MIIGIGFLLLIVSLQVILLSIDSKLEKILEEVKK